MGETRNEGPRPSFAERPQESGAAALGRGGRMSRQRKTAAVLRLLRGEELETVSRALVVTAATLTRWRDAFLAGAEKRRWQPKPSNGEDVHIQADVGDRWTMTRLLGMRPGAGHPAQSSKPACCETGRPYLRRTSGLAGQLAEAGKRVIVEPQPRRACVGHHYNVLCKVAVPAQGAGEVRP